ncbi:MAG: amidohydrolase family protein [Actinomycetota bacterium]
MSYVVDIHSHLYPGWFVDRFRHRDDVPLVVEEEGEDRFLLFQAEDGRTSGPLLTDEYTTLEAKIEFMDRHGIDCSVVSLGNPWFEFCDPEVSLALAREANEALSPLARETSGRIVGMGVLPRSDPESVAAVVEEVGADPGLRGVISATTIGGLLLDDARLEPVWKTLGATGVPLMIHPLMARVPQDLSGYGIALSAGIGFPAQTTIALSRLLLAGVLERHPQVRLVAAHGGGALPFLIGRLEGTNVLEPRYTALRRQAGALLLDAALYDPGSVRLTADLVGADRLLFGTDHPFPNADVSRIHGAISAALSDTEAALVMGESATRWYGLEDG